MLAMAYVDVMVAMTYNDSNHSIRGDNGEIHRRNSLEAC